MPNDKKKKIRLNEDLKKAKSILHGPPSNYFSLSSIEQSKFHTNVKDSFAVKIKKLGFEWDSNRVTHNVVGVMDQINECYPELSDALTGLLDTRDVADKFITIENVNYTITSHWNILEAVISSCESAAKLSKLDHVKAEIERAIQADPEFRAFTITADREKQRLILSHADHPELWTGLKEEEAKNPQKALSKYAGHVKEHEYLMRSLTQGGAEIASPSGQVIKDSNIEITIGKKTHVVDYSRGAQQALVQVRGAARALGKANNPAPKNIVAAPVETPAAALPALAAVIEQAVAVPAQEEKPAAAAPVMPIVEVEIAKNSPRELAPSRIPAMPITPDHRRTRRAEQSIRTETDQVVLMLDANLLINLYHSGELNSILEELTKLPNVTVVITATVANRETRGVTETWEHNDQSGMAIKATTVNNLFSREKTNDPDITAAVSAEAAKLKEFFHNAYRIRLYSDATSPEIFAPKNGANPRLIICETDLCRWMTAEFEGAKVSSRAALRKDAGERTIDDFLDTLPINAPAIVLCDETEYDDWGTKWTKYHQPVHHAGVADLLNAIYPNKNPGKLHDVEQMSPKAREVLQKITDERKYRDNTFKEHHPRETIQEGIGAESLAAVVARGRALRAKKQKVEPPFKPVIEQYQPKPPERSSLPIVGTILTSLMHEHGIKHEDLVKKVNELNKVKTFPQTPAFTVDVLHSYLSGEARPDQDTMYALLEALVWQSSKLSADEKKVKTKELLDAWQEAEKPDKQASFAGLERADSSVSDDRSAKYKRLGTLMRELKGNKPERDLLDQIINRKTPPKFPEDSVGLKSALGTAASNDRSFVIKCVRAIDMLAAERGPIAYEEKLALFSMMLDAQNGHNGHAK